jgi:hypothetical protein
VKQIKGAGFSTDPVVRPVLKVFKVPFVVPVIEFTEIVNLFLAGRQDVRVLLQAVIKRCGAGFLGANNDEVRFQVGHGI